MSHWQRCYLKTERKTTGLLVLCRIIFSLIDSKIYICIYVQWLTKVFERLHMQTLMTEIMYIKVICLDKSRCQEEDGSLKMGVKILILNNLIIYVAFKYFCVITPTYVVESLLNFTVILM